MHGLMKELSPYPAYKSSGANWLGDMPAHWETLKLRSVLSGTNERNRTDLPLLSVVREKGVILRDVANMDENHNFIPDDLSNYKAVYAGQFAMNKMKAWQGSYGVSLCDGIVSPAYFVFDVHRLTGDFFHTAIRARAYVPFFAQASDGVRIGQWDLSQSRMREIPFFSPPLTEQVAIVRYLDHVDRRIRRYVTAKEKLIGLLDEEKQAIINQAVTRGLDPSVRLKPSELEWLGDFPEHWDVTRIAAAARNGKDAFTDGDWVELPHITDSGIRLIQTGNVGTGMYREKGFRYIHKSSFAELRCTEVDPGDVLICRLADPVGRACLAPDLGVRMITSVDVCILKSSEQFSADYLVFLFSSKRYLGFVESLVRGSTRNRISRSILGAIKIPSPPSPEQHAIAAFLNREAERINSLIEKNCLLVERVQEYRTRLIADVVTGKLDVREAAAALTDLDGRGLTRFDQLHDFGHVP